MKNGSKNAAKVTKSAKSEKATNCYREGGSYWAVVETLRKLGIGKMHKADAFVKAYPAVVGADAWKAFKAKEARNEATAKDATARVIQNAIVVNRPDYGASLREIGFEVRKDRKDGGYLFGLFAIKPQTAPKAVQKPQVASKAKGKGKDKAAKSKASKAK
jgi:hypothetical protein